MGNLGDVDAVAEAVNDEDEEDGEHLGIVSEHLPQLPLPHALPNLLLFPTLHLHVLNHQPAIHHRYHSSQAHAHEVEVGTEQSESESGYESCWNVGQAVD